MPAIDDAARQQLRALGDFIRQQRQMGELSLRELAARANVSNPYLSQIERGLHEPSVRVLKAIATALNVSAESLLAQAGLLQELEGTGAGTETTERAIEHDPRLRPEQRSALLAVYRSYVAANDAEEHRARTRGSSSKSPRKAAAAKKRRPPG